MFTVMKTGAYVNSGDLIGTSLKELLVNSGSMQHNFKQLNDSTWQYSADASQNNYFECFEC